MVFWTIAALYQVFLLYNCTNHHQQQSTASSRSTGQSLAANPLPSIYSWQQIVYAKHNDWFVTVTNLPEYIYVTQHVRCKQPAPRVLYLRQPMRRPSQKGFPQGKKGGSQLEERAENTNGKGWTRSSWKKLLPTCLRIFSHVQSATRARALAFQPVLYSDSHRTANLRRWARAGQSRATRQLDGLVTDGAC